MFSSQRVHSSATRRDVLFRPKEPKEPQGLAGLSRWAENDFVNITSLFPALGENMRIQINTNRIY